MKPILLLDIDGTLCPFGLFVMKDEYVWTLAGSSSLYIAQRNIDALKQLMEVFEVVWCTGWENEANIVVGPLHELPPLRVVPFTGVRMTDATWKLSAVDRWVQRFARKRPIAWIDDELQEDVEQWAEDRPWPTLLIKTDPAIGIVAANIEDLFQFAESCQDDLPIRT